jgi:hypothetical protein
MTIAVIMAGVDAHGYLVSVTLRTPMDLKHKFKEFLQLHQNGSIRNTSLGPLSDWTGGSSADAKKLGVDSLLNWMEEPSNGGWTLYNTSNDHHLRNFVFFFRKEQESQVLSLSK